MSTAASVREQVFNIAKSRRWFSAMDLIQATGSPSADRRRRELEAEGYPFKKRQASSGDHYEYRMTSTKKATA